MSISIEIKCTQINNDNNDNNDITYKYYILNVMTYVYICL